MAQAPAHAATQRNFTQSNLEAQTTRSDAYVHVATKVGTRKQHYLHGYGTPNRQNADTGYTYADIQAVEEGDLQGTVRFVVYHSEDMEIPKAIGDEMDLDDLREAVDESRSDRPVVAFGAGCTRNGRPVGASEDEVLALEVKVEDEHDGAEIDPNASDVKIPYSEYRKTA